MKNFQEKKEIFFFKFYVVFCCGENFGKKYMISDDCCVKVKENQIHLDGNR